MCTDRHLAYQRSYNCNEFRRRATQCFTSQTRLRNTKVKGPSLVLRPTPRGNVSPVVRIAGMRARLGYNSASIAIDKEGRLYTTRTAHFLKDVYIWPPGSNGDTKRLTTLSTTCGHISGKSDVSCFRSNRSSLGGFAARTVQVSSMNTHDFPKRYHIILLLSSRRCAKSSVSAIFII